MEKHRKKFSIRLIEKIGHDEEEREIIQYGLHQGFLILLNLLTTVVCGILWKELPFVLLVFWGIFFFLFCVFCILVFRFCDLAFLD